VVSANLQNPIKEKCLEMGVFRFLDKPPDKKKIGDAIEEILNK